MNRKKVMIIDDEVLVRRSLRRVFEAKGWQAIEAANGAEGATQWRQIKPDLVFLDVLMPIMSGPELLRELTDEEKKGVKIILISAYTGEHNLETAKDLGAHLFVEKPFEDIFKLYDLANKLLSSQP